jgi:hypothetical protein
VRLRNADIYVYRSTGVTATQLAGDTTLSLTTGNWYWIRFQFSGSNYKAKIWADGDSEPTTGGAGDGWNVSNTDDTYSTAGSVGLCKGANTTSHVWSMFGVGTNGDTAPTSAPATGVTGTGSLTTGATTSSGSGTLIHKGTGALSLAATTLSGSGTKTGSTVTLSAATVTDITTTTATPRVTLDFA